MASVTKPPKEPRKRVQIRIIDLLAWMTGTALLMAGYQLFNQSRLSEDPLDQAASATLRLLYSSIYGACLAGATFVAWARIRPRAKLAPGHWLLLIQAVGLIVGFSWWAWHSHWEDDLTGDTRLLWSEIFTIGINLSVGLFYLLLAGHTYDSPRWTALFVGIGLVDLFSAGYHAVFAISFFYFDAYGLFSYPYHGRAVFALVMLIWATIVAAIDISVKSHRDGLHWTGVGVQISLVIAGLMQFVWWEWISSRFAY